MSKPVDRSPLGIGTLVRVLLTLPNGYVGGTVAEWRTRDGKGYEYRVSLPGAGLAIWKNHGQ